MRIFLSIAVVTIALISFTSCQKCYNCTYNVNGESLNDSSVCGTGKSIKDQIWQMERNEWVCEKE